MRSAFHIALLFVISIAFSATIDAQNENDDRGTTPAKLLKTPAMKVPAEAIKSGLGGKVNVLVNIRKDGTVASVESVSGPDWVCPTITRMDVLGIRDAAKTAALGATFEPAREDDKPKESSMFLTFNFPQKKTQNIKGEANYTAATVPAPKPEENEKPAEKYTVKGDVALRTGEVNSTDRYTIGAPASSVSQSPRQISGGVLNGKATKLTKPAYPPAARAVRASGAVTIEVLIDEVGDIFSAAPISGHPLLRSSARIAACSSKFSPTILEGNPVKVSGVIVYNFVP